MSSRGLSGGHLGPVPRTWVWSAICQLTPNMDPPKRLSIAHWKALYLLSHKSSSGGGGGGGEELCPLEESKYIFY